MEPQIVSSSPSPEMGAYHAPETPKHSASGEVASDKEKVKINEIGEQPRGDSPPSAPIAALPQLPSLPAPKVASTLNPPAKDSNPVAASDEDLIEKEWVDKAKKIVAQTRDDPYSQEKEVSKLQADYLKKRYGKEIKLNSD